MSQTDMRLAALRRFAVAITILNVCGRLWLGFENSWAQMFAAVLTAYLVEIVLEVVDARANERPFKFAGGWGRSVDFLLPAHISGLAVSMLLYAGGLLLPFAFASAVGIASKTLFTARVNKSARHFLNPSNTGVAVTVLLFPVIAPAVPYQFTEYLSGGFNRALPVVVLCVGTFMNWRYTKRMPLVLSWVVAFALQGEVRCLLNDLPLFVGLAPMTGVSFVLFTFYMITDPGATPSGRRGQVIFGAATASVYALLMLTHVGFALFYALLIVSAARGLLLHLKAAPDSPLSNVTTRGEVAREA
jgi:Na+-translocating ferredoxin:NAD+ oxidoreductase RnfD subunit